MLSHISRLMIAALALLASNAAWATTHALIMSIGEYQSGITPLAGTKYDLVTAREIAHKLGVKDANIVELHDGALSLEGMRKAFDDFIGQVGENDEVFIYYSGHGGRQYVQEPAERCAESLVTVDGRAFIDTELEARLKALSAKAHRVIAFLDSCHSGGATSRALHLSARTSRFTPKYWAKGEVDACAKPTNVITRGLGAKSRDIGSGALNYVYIAAARDSEVSLDEPGKGGIATQAWLACMSGDAADANASGGLTAEEIRVCAQKRIDETLKGVEGVTPNHLTISGNANAVMMMSEDAPSAQGDAAVKAAPPYETLMDIYNNRDDRRVVKLIAKKAELQIGQDRLEYTLTTSHPGYVYVLMVGSDGQTFDLLYPNALEKGHYLEAGETMTLPAAPGLKIVAQGPAGKDHLLAVISDSQRDFSRLGAQPAGPFSVLNASLAAKRNLQIVASEPGNAECDKATTEKRNLMLEHECSDAYGAAILTVEEIEGKPGRGVRF